MRTIPEAYEGRGKGDQLGFLFTLEQIYRTDSDSHTGVALYSKRKGVNLCYEVAIIRKRKHDVTLGGNAICKKGDEYLPSSREWGAYGWTYNDKKLAIKKFKELIKEMK